MKKYSKFDRCWAIALVFTGALVFITLCILNFIHVANVPWWAVFLIPFIPVILTVLITTIQVLYLDFSRRRQHKKWEAYMQSLRDKYTDKFEN